VANKIERQLYDKDSLLQITDQFETVDLSGKIEPSLKAIYLFIRNSVLFFKSKLEPSEKQAKASTYNVKLASGFKSGKKTIKKQKKIVNHKQSKSKVLESSEFLKQVRNESNSKFISQTRAISRQR
jgi:hypothetical protein